MENVKRAVPWLIIITALYCTLSQPDTASDVVKSAFAAGGESVRKLFDAIGLG